VKISNKVKFFLHLKRVFAILRTSNKLAEFTGLLLRLHFSRSPKETDSGSDRFKNKVFTLLHLKNLISVKLL
jgi:hypothetical protein